MPTPDLPPLPLTPRRAPLRVRLRRAQRLPPAAQILVLIVAVVIGVINLGGPAPLGSPEPETGDDTLLPISIRGRHVPIVLPGEVP